jgi:hypothetical protein
LFHVIERCCAIATDARYNSLAELRQSLSAAYDVLLERKHGAGKAGLILEAILGRLDRNGQFRVRELKEFIELLCILEIDDRMRMCFDLDRRVFSILGQEPMGDLIARLLSIYREMVEDFTYSWTYAETIAKNMHAIASSPAAPNAQKAIAIELAIHAAVKQNRFAPMDTCIEMLTAVRDEELGLMLREVLLKFPGSFLEDIDRSDCKSDAIRRAIIELAEVNETA